MGEIEINKLINDGFKVVMVVPFQTAFSIALVVVVFIIGKLVIASAE